MNPKKSSKFLSVGIDIGADFSLMSIALPGTELVGNPYRILNSNLNSLQGAIDRIQTMEFTHKLKARFLWNQFIIARCIIS